MSFLIYCDSGYDKCVLKKVPYHNSFIFGMLGEIFNEHNFDPKTLGLELVQISRKKL